MPWRALNDPDNPQNWNAGNGGDIVKHTVYLTVWDYLLTLSPWSVELRVRECHAGRGMYCIPGDDVRRRPLLECLYDPIQADVGVLLHDVQRASQTALHVWPAHPTAFEWYSGSAVVNAWWLGSADRGRHLLELYELAPDTRSILRALFAQPGFQLPALHVRICPDADNGHNFDGEMYIENNIAARSIKNLSRPSRPPLRPSRPVQRWIFRQAEKELTTLPVLRYGSVHRK